MVPCILQQVNRAAFFFGILLCGPYREVAAMTPEQDGVSWSSGVACVVSNSYVSYEVFPNLTGSTVCLW